MNDEPTSPDDIGGGESPQGDVYSDSDPAVDASRRVEAALRAYYRRLNSDTSIRRRDRTNRISRWLKIAEPEDQVGPPQGSVGFLQSDRAHELEEEILQLTRQLDAQTKALLEEQQEAGAVREKFTAALGTLEELQAKQAMTSIIGRIDPAAEQVLLDASDLRAAFLTEGPCQAFVVSVDLRRSTDLMLKAREPQLFAQFIRGLCDSLRDIIVSEQGVFDKFTGDGVLAFFPEFYSGEDAAFRAVRAAEECHKAFRVHYQRNYSSFHSVLKDVGLGIGIDHGVIHLVRVGGEITVVGTPVVYACRMSGAPAGTTLLNQPAYEEVVGRFSAYCSIQETEIEIKHEGVHVGYLVRLSGRQYEPGPPAWKSYVSAAADQVVDKEVRAAVAAPEDGRRAVRAP